MDTLVESTTSILASYWFFSLGIATAFYGFSIWLGGHLSKESKDTVALWLWGEYESTWTKQFCEFFDTFFGEKHLSLRCFLVSSIASIIAVLLMFVLFGPILGFLDTGSRTGEDISFVRVLTLGILLNIIPDYISLFETRWILGRFSKATTFFSQLLILIVDAVFTGVIIWVAISLFLLLSDIESLTAAQMIGIFSIYSLFFYSTFLTSLWAWLYCISTWVVKLFCRTKLNKVLDVETNPIKQLALVGAVLLLISELLLQPVFKTSSADGVSIFNDFMCNNFSSTCERVSILTADDEMALVYLAQACNGTGDSEICADAAFRYYGGDNEQAAKLWSRACNEGNALGCGNLGVMYNDGRGVEQDDMQAASFYRQGCDGGNGLGCNNLGVMYQNGQGVEQDETQAVSLYGQGCDGGYATGCTNLGLMYDNGRGVEQDDMQAASFYRQGCDAGEGIGCTSLGLMYDNGRGVEQDDMQAASLYRQGCDAGEGIGCTSLGVMYEFGQGVEQNDMQAASLYRQGCDAGNGIGCNKLGVMYQNGQGVEQDDVEAGFFFRQGCDVKNATACNNLEILSNTN